MEYWQVGVLLICVFMNTAVNIILGAGSHDHSHDHGTHRHHHNVSIKNQSFKVSVAINGGLLTKTFGGSALKGNLLVLLNASDWFSHNQNPGKEFPATIYQDTYKGYKFVHFINGIKHHEWVIPRCRFSLVEKYLLYYFRDIMSQKTKSTIENIIEECRAKKGGTG